MENTFISPVGSNKYLFSPEKNTNLNKRKDNPEIIINVLENRFIQLDKNGLKTQNVISENSRSR